MKQIPFTNHKGEELLFVKLPKEAYDFYIYRKRLFFDLPNNDCDLINLSEFGYQILSPLSEMNEDLWKEVVDEASNEFYDGFKDYSINQISALHSATESGESLMQSLGIYLVNPYGEEPKCKIGCKCSQGEAYDCLGDYTLWQEAESMVGNWVLIQKIK